MENNKIAFFLPTRKGSERVKNKNTRPFANIEGGLVENKLRQLLATKFIDEKDKHGHYELPRSLNQEKLSKILGTTRVTVNKKIKELRQKRVLLQKERNMRIANKAIEEFKKFL